MKRSNVDRSWFEDGVETATLEARTERMLEQVTEQRAAEARMRIKIEKDQARKRANRPVLLGKMYPASYWSELLGFSDEAIRRWCKSGELQGQWIRNTWRITEAAVLEFLKKENEGHGRKI